MKTAKSAEDVQFDDYLWLGSQRKEQRKGLLTCPKVKLLEQIPGWEDFAKAKDEEVDADGEDEGQESSGGGGSGDEDVDGGAEGDQEIDADATDYALFRELGEEEYARQERMRLHTEYSHNRDRKGRLAFFRVAFAKFHPDKCQKYHAGRKQVWPYVQTLWKKFKT